MHVFIESSPVVRVNTTFLLNGPLSLKHFGNTLFGTLYSKGARTQAFKLRTAYLVPAYRRKNN